MSDSVRTQGLQPTRFLCPWDSPGKNTGVGCHFLLQFLISRSLYFFFICLIIIFSYCPPGKFLNLIFWLTNLFYKLVLFIHLSYFSELIFRLVIFLLGAASVQFSCSVVSDSLRPHELQHARPPCPS